MSATQLADALRVAGINQRDVDFDKSIAFAIERFIASGGTNEGALMRLQRIVERMSGMGQKTGADNGPMLAAQTRQPFEDGEAIQDVPQGQRRYAPSSSSDRGGEGQHAPARQGHTSSALPVREPKPQRAPIDFGAAALAIKTKLAQSSLDRFTTSYGRPWGDVGAHELDSMIRDGALAKPLKEHLGQLSNKQRFMTIRELVSPETFDAIRSKAYGA